MRKWVLVVLLLLVCMFDGIVHYREQKALLDAEWNRELAILQRDMAIYRLQHQCP